MKKLSQILLITFCTTIGLPSICGCGEQYVPVSNQRGPESADGEDDYFEPGQESVYQEVD